MSIFHVNSNLKHSGSFYSVGQFIDGELAEFGELVKSGVLRIVEGAKNFAEAAQIVGAEADAKAEAEASAPPPPEDTWAPKKDDESAPEAPAGTEQKAPAPSVPDPKPTSTSSLLPPGELGTGDQSPEDDAANL